MKLKKYIGGGLVATLMLLATSCRDETFSEFFDDGSDVNKVSFTIDLEGMGERTRATDGTYLSEKIGGGSRVDVLKYAVYYKTSDGRWEADDSYGDSNSETIGKVEPGHGQTVLPVKSFPVVVNLALKKSETYRVVFWAQSSQTDAFNTEDLRKVQMKYKVMNVSGDEAAAADAGEQVLSINNDENRDAFCRSIEVPAGTSLKNQTVYLRRPLAQINIGTRGFDYETITRNAEKKYYYSKVRINRAARYLDVVEDKILTSTTIDDNDTDSPAEAFYVVDYDYALFPAYWKANMPDDIQSGFHPSYTIYDFDTEGKPNSYVSTSVNLQSEWPVYQKEEFLKVKLFSDTDDENPETDADGNIINYSELGNDGYRIYTGLGDGNEANDKVGEVFKYLSMCYVLTNCEPKNDGSGEDTSDVITNLKMWIATDANGSDEVEVLNLHNVPVQRNRRTNIVGALLTTKANVSITVDSDFAGQKLDGSAEGLSGEIAEGIYYDAENDVVQISSVNGLLVFQQLVNGDLTVRSVGNNTGYSNMIGGKYPYYSEDGSGNLEYLEYQSIKRPDDPVLRNRILAATHYHLHKEFDDGYEGKITEDDSDWPTLNNFSFAGATVKLMADINLDGIEWIPIGFDMVNWDSSFTYVEPGGTGWDGLNYRSIVYPLEGSGPFSYDSNKSKVVVARRRVFCGTFDGNGHAIYNVKSKRFSANVHESQFQWKTGTTNNNMSPYDNVQWFGQGFFGIVGPGANIENVRLQNIDIFGRNGVGGLVAVVSSIGWPAAIENCVIDGGKITAYPLYRGDDKNSVQSSYGRTFARGVYVGGVVGQFSAIQGSDPEAKFGVNNCEVRNVTIHGYRRIGGIIGAVSDGESSDKMKVTNGIYYYDNKIKFKNNSVSNSTILADQFMPFDNLVNQQSQNSSGDKRWQTGFGWGSTLQSQMGIFVGGDQDKYSYEGSASNVKFSEFKVTGVDANNNQVTSSNEGVMRKTTIDNVPLEMIPMLSSWYTDEVTLNNNYYGTSGINTRIQYTNSAQIWSNYGDSKFKVPFLWPYEPTVNYVTDSPKAAMYVESILLDGSNAPGNRSVVTADNTNGFGDCVMYVTARDRKQFTGGVWDARAGDQKNNVPANIQDLSKLTALQTGKYKEYNKAEQPTTIKNMVLKGQPYAWTGILLAPNENMSKIELDNVNIYDVYQTICLDRQGLYSGDEYGTLLNSTGTNPFDPSKTEMDIKNSNFRGFTNPGAGWNKITYSGTTFEKGAETKYSSDSSKDEEFMTCKVYKTLEGTIFDGCYFKAPYVIDLSALDGSLVDFRDCYATSAYKNVIIDNDQAKKAKRIVIYTDVKLGETKVKYE